MIKAILDDPSIIVEGIVQQVSDAKDEKGLAYCTGYTAGLIAQMVLLKKVKGGSGAEGGIDSGLTQSKIDEILSIDKGKRPDPSTYLSSEYIEQHLKQFDNGGSFVMTKKQYMRFVEGNPYIGCPDNTQFIAPKDFMDKIDNIANGDISIYEKKLGFDDGHFSADGGLVRFDIKDAKSLNVRIPSGNEFGANEHWIPGGYTDGGTAEAIIDNIPNNDDFVDIIFLR
ncbi:hypothetical protein [Clostridium cibarium]|uniref:Uncharacterized protein n=1 Tax=Clostridium cibarium TaxID=2762247 RepID=A0ABR8PUG0_9CLOT|nr:hypothetical protein [Clostridium cibarium]MBD7911792.1 hypothetical protein [Clostridium cibarium]